MRLLEAHTQLECRPDPYNLYAIGDIHIGSTNCHYEEFLASIREIEEDPNCGVIVMGDVIDAIGTADPRYTIEGIDSRFTSPKALRNLPKAQCNYAIQHFDRIRDKIVMWLSGNHESKVKKFSAKAGYEIDPTEYMCEALGLEDKNVDYVGCLRWEFRADNAPKKGADVVTIVAQHGFGGGRLKGGKINNMDKALNSVEADCFLMGHTHELMASRKVRNIIDKKDGDLRHHAHDMLMVNTGTFLKTYESSMEYKASEYGEVMMYEPTHIGMARCVVYPKRKIIRAVI